MTQYDLSTALANDTVIDWSSTSLWAGGKVPDNAAALVVFQPIDAKTYFVEIGAGETFAANTLDMEAHQLRLFGTLHLHGALNITSQSSELDLFDGTLTAGTIHLAGAPFWRGITGVGHVTVSGQLYNQSSISAEEEPNLATGTELTVHAGRLVNAGLLDAGPLATLVVSATDFTNYSGGALIGGTYQTTDGTLDLRTPDLVTIDDASLIFDTGTGIFSYDPAGRHYVPIESTLAFVTAHGSLEIDATSYAASVGLSDYGSIAIEGAGGQFTGPRLSIAAGGTVTLGNGSTSNTVDISVGQLSNNGTMTALAGPGAASPDIISSPAVTGSGTIVIGPQTSVFEQGKTIFFQAAAELTGPVSNAIKFSDGTGTVILDAPNGMTGQFQQFQAGAQIILSGISASSVTGFDYSGSTSSGVLTIHEGSSSTMLAFAGDYTTANFSLSSSPHGVDIVGVACRSGSASAPAAPPCLLDAPKPVIVKLAGRRPVRISVFASFAPHARISDRQAQGRAAVRKRAGQPGLLGGQRLDRRPAAL